MSLPRSSAKPSVLSARVQSPTSEATTKTTTHLHQTTSGLEDPSAMFLGRFQRDNYIEVFGMDTGEAETSADSEEAANRVYSFSEQTTEVDIS